MNDGIVACPICGLVQRLGGHRDGWAACARCDSVVARPWDRSLSRTAAFSLAALLFYLPANIHPFMRMEIRGVTRESTIWDGCVRLVEDGHWMIAIIVFLASLAIPLLKLVGLFALVVTTSLKSSRAQVARAWVYRIIVWMGPWAMLDVFVLAILVAMASFGRIATVTPGPGLLAFTSVVVLTILAAASFEPRRIWQTRRGSG